MAKVEPLCIQFSSVCKMKSWLEWGTAWLCVHHRGTFEVNIFFWWVVLYFSSQVCCVGVVGGWWWGMLQISSNDARVRNLDAPEPRVGKQLTFAILEAIVVKSVKCYAGRWKIHFIPSIYKILSRKCDRCVQYTRLHLMSLISHC